MSCRGAIERLRGLRIGARAARYLTEQACTGSVASTFRYGFSALFDEPEELALVSI